MANLYKILTMKIENLDWFFYLDELYGEVDDFLDEVTYEFGEGLELLPEGEYIEVIPAVEEDPFKIENPLLSAEKRVEKLYGILDEKYINQIRSQLIVSYREYNKLTPSYYVPGDPIRLHKEDILQYLIKEKIML